MATARRIIVTGATGAIGRPLCTALAACGYEVVVFTRDPRTARRSIPEASDVVAWDPLDARATRGWVRAVDSAYGVVHLAGAPVFGPRWSRGRKNEIYRSRVLSTWMLAAAMAEARNRPTVFISSSAVGFYGFRDDTPLGEDAAPGTDFLAQVCRDWEAATRRAAEAGIRTILLRSGIVLDSRAGPLPEMIRPFRFGVGGPILPGTQWVPWIHIADEIGLITWALENSEVYGPLNAVAPEPVTNWTLSHAIGQTMRSPAWLPIPGLLLRLLFGEFATTVTCGQRAVPAKALALGYSFHYPTLEPALQHLLRPPLSFYSLREPTARSARSC